MKIDSMKPDGAFNTMPALLNEGPKTSALLIRQKVRTADSAE
jgi:hypothetical protein